jgi:crotonobetainyl-CoA:carnitine CoA-transferase CaiB-like acyl-CoA transferase
MRKRLAVSALVAVVAALYATSSTDEAVFGTTPADWELPESVPTTAVHPGAAPRAKPIIAVVGLSRTGTSSLTAALEMLNMTVYHSQETIAHHLDFWTYYLTGRIHRPDVHKLLDGSAGDYLPRADAVLDSWYAILAPDLLRAYPDARVILTTRDVDKWLESYQGYVRGSHLYHYTRQSYRLMLAAISRTLRLGKLLRAAGLLDAAGGLELEKLPQLMRVWRRCDEVVYGDYNPSGSRTRWIDAFKKHHAYIRTLVPKEQLLEFDLGKGHGWKELTDFLRIPKTEASKLAAKPFPHAFAGAHVASGGVSSASYSATRTHELLTFTVSLLIALFLFTQFALVLMGVRAPAPPPDPTAHVDANGFEYVLCGERHERQPPTLGERLHARLVELQLRVSVYLRLIREYPKMREVFAAHKKDGYFDYGTPGDFGQLLSHEATRHLLSFRVGRPHPSAGGGSDGEGATNGHKPNGANGTVTPHETPTAELVGGGGSAKAADTAAPPPALGLHSTLEFEDDGSLLPTYLPVEHGAAAALGALGLAAADLFELRTGEAQQVRVARTDAGLATAGYLFIKIDAAGPYGGCDGFAATIEQEGKVNPVRKAYTCRDGASVFMHGGFPKLKQGILDFFGGVKPTVEAIGREAAKWDGPALERAMQDKGLAVTLCRSPPEFRAHPQGQAVLAAKLIDVEVRRPTAAGTPVARLLPTGRSVTRPLSDVLVLDFSHVIASPVVGRSLLEHGATVIKLVTYSRPRRHLFDEEANAGKLTYELTLETEAGKARLWALLRAADVLIDGYTDGVLARHGFPIDDVLSVCPHLVYCQVACYGFTGPFAGKKGFQQNANFCAGVAGLDDEELLGYQLVSQIDYATGFLGAYAVMLGLAQRQLAAMRGEAIRGVHVRVSLCGTATWMSQYGATCPSPLQYLARITRLLFGCGDRPVRAGNMTYLPSPIRMSATPPTRVAGFHRWWREAKVYKL